MYKRQDADCGPDSSFSILPDQLELLCNECNTAFEAVKSNKLERPSSESPNKKFRRSVYFVNDLKEGDVITENDIKRIRPGYGLDPKYFNEVVGQRLKLNVDRGQPVSWDVFD